MRAARGAPTETGPQAGVPRRACAAASTGIQHGRDDRTGRRLLQRPPPRQRGERRPPGERLHPPVPRKPPRPQPLPGRRRGPELRARHERRRRRRPPLDVHPPQGPLPPPLPRARRSVGPPPGRRLLLGDRERDALPPRAGLRRHGVHRPPDRRGLRPPRVRRLHVGLLHEPHPRPGDSLPRDLRRGGGLGPLRRGPRRRRLRDRHRRPRLGRSPPVRGRGANPQHRRGSPEALPAALLLRSGGERDGLRHDVRPGGAGPLRPVELHPDERGRPDPHSPAWDWQYVIRAPEIGRTYRYRARLLYRPFVDREAVRRAYEEWAAGP